MTIDYPWYSVALCVLAGLLYAGAMYFVGPRRFGRGLRWLLAGLRMVAVSAAALLLLAPVSRQTVHERQKPRVVLVRDCSQSVALGADSAFSFEALRQALGDRCDVVLAADASNPMQTDLGALIDVGQDVDAVVLASDGINNRGANPTSVAERLSYPVYTIALGDTTPQRDAAVGDLRVARIAMLGGSFALEINVAARLLRGQCAVLSVADAAGRQLFSQRVAYEDDDYAATVATTLPADKAGLQRYSVTLGVVADEVNSRNNSTSFYVDVIDARRKVAIVGNAPHPDLGALKRAIEGNPNYEATVMLAGQMGAKPLAADEWSLVVLHNLPSQQHPDLRFADGLPALYIIGTQTDLSRFNALRTGLEIVSRTSKTNEVTALGRQGFGLFHLEPATVEAIEALPPLTATFGEGKLAADVQTLFGARLGNIDMQQPLVAASAQGATRRAFVWGEGLWRWRLADWQTHESHEHFDRLVSQLVGFAAMQQQRQRLQVEADRRYDEGQAPVLHAQLYNESYELTNDAEVKLHLRGDSVDAEYTFQRTASAYRLALPGLRPGLYRYAASTADGLGTEGSFAVEALGLEQRRTVADHALLRSISAVSGAFMVHPAEIDRLEAQLLELKPIIYTHTRYAEFLRLPLVLAIIVLLLAAEWVLRKYHGEL